MHFLIALVALAACYACWHFFWSDADFKPYLVTLSAQYGPKGMIVFWLSAAFALWGLLINESAPPALSLLASIVTAILWLNSPNGEKWLKERV